MELKFSRTSGPRLLGLLLCLHVLLVEVSSGHLQFAQWAKPCKIPSLDPSEFLKPHEECDASKGIICQKFQEGALCGCQIGHTLTYDRRSGECRRKVGAVCHLPEKHEDYIYLTFNHKCHEDAMCVRPNSTLANQDPKRASQLMCTCKPGYVALQDFSACVDPNGSTSLKGQIFLISVLMLASGFYFCR